MKTVVIYHRADFDGIFCRELARRFLPDSDLIGWDYNDPEPHVSKEDKLYILDLSIQSLMDHPNLIWIDHHKSAMEKYPADIPGCRIDGVAACRLAWQWFFLGMERFSIGHRPLLPEKDAYLDRTVNEPMAIRLAGEYDIGDRRDPNAELFQHGLRSQDLSPEDWQSLLDWPDEHSVSLTIHLRNQGRAVQYAKTKENASIIANNGFTISFEGLTFLA
jgi:hypothetical protein